MTLLEIVDALETIGLEQPLVLSTGEGNIYDYMDTNPSVKYGVFFITQGTHIEYEDHDDYTFTLFYVDRLEDNDANRLRVQSYGKQILSNIITTFCTDYDIDFPEITYTPFTQKFQDLCAGVYCDVVLEVYKSDICEEAY